PETRALANSPHPGTTLPIDAATHATRWSDAPSSRCSSTEAADGRSSSDRQPAPLGSAHGRSIHNPDDRRLEVDVVDDVVDAHLDNRAGDEPLRAAEQGDAIDVVGLPH